MERTGSMNDMVAGCEHETDRAASLAGTDAGRAIAISTETPQAPGSTNDRSTSSEREPARSPQWRRPPIGDTTTVFRSARLGADRWACPVVRGWHGMSRQVLDRGRVRPSNGLPTAVSMVSEASCAGDMALARSTRATWFGVADQLPMATRCP